MSPNKLITVKDLPSPKGHFLLGHLPEFNKNNNKHQVLEGWARECGELFQINFAGTKIIVSTNPDFNHQILNLRPEKIIRLAKMSEIIRELGVTGTFNAEGATWRRHRPPISKALNVRKIKIFYPVLMEKTQNLLRKFQEYARANQEVSVQKELMLFTIDVTTKIAFGYDMDMINNQADAFQHHLESIFPMVNERISSPLPLWRWFKQKKDKELLKSIGIVEKTIHQFIKEAKTRLEQHPELKEKPTNLLESLLIENEENNLSDDELFGNVFTILMAGEDTTSNSISWAIYYLAQSPEIVSQIREEATQVYGVDEWPATHKQLSELAYTNAVVQETLRIKPTTPQLYLEAKDEVIVENLVIPKGTKVILQNKVAQTMEQYFSQPDQFMPERWLKSACPFLEKHSPEVVKTFGAGPRFCPGKYLAENEMTILLSALCKKFNMELAVDPDSITEQFQFTMYPGNLIVKFQEV